MYETDAWKQETDTLYVDNVWSRWMKHETNILDINGYYYEPGMKHEPEIICKKKSENACEVQMRHESET